MQASGYSVLSYFVYIYLYIHAYILIMMLLYCTWATYRSKTQGGAGRDIPYSVYLYSA